ncbi:hypothetical protein BH11BAC3_BH11BAC3_10650 [soil metagenome]
MKKIISTLIITLLLLANTSFAQFSAGFSNVGNVLTFKVKPLTAKTTGFSVLEFFVRYPTSSAAFTYGPITANITNFPGMTSLGTFGSGSWEIERNNAAYVIPGYNVDHIFYTAPAPTSSVMTYNMNQVYDVITIPLMGDANFSINFELVHQDTEASFYLALTSEVGADLRPAAFTDYFFPTTAQTPGPSGSVIYYSALAVPLPVKFIGFNVAKKDKDALLTWQIENETAQVDAYEIERSTNGVDFVKVDAIAAKNNGNTTNTYNFTDANFTRFRSSGVIYYRIKQMDKDGRFTLTNIKNLRLDTKNIAVSVYPNPIKNFATVSFDLLRDATVKMTINDASGKQVQTIPLQLFKGVNTKKIDMSTLAAGAYMLSVNTGEEVQNIALVKVN